MKERLWFWCHNAGVYNDIKGLNDKSDYTPVDAANYMGIQNIIMVAYNGKPQPPFSDFHHNFCHFKKVVWSLIGDSACKYESTVGYLEDIIALSREYSNITGGIMDDFFHAGRSFDITAISDKMQANSLPLWVVLYTYQMARNDVWDKLDKCDIINLWTWNSVDLKNLEYNIMMLKEKMPHKKIALGCYLWDFGTGKEITISEMEYQCNIALKYLKNQAIDEIVILGSPLIGMKLPTINWTRDWIKDNFA